MSMPVGLPYNGTLVTYLKAMPSGLAAWALPAKTTSNSDTAAANACIRNMGRVPYQINWTLLMPLRPGDANSLSDVRVSGESFGLRVEPIRDCRNEQTVAAAPRSILSTKKLQD